MTRSDGIIPSDGEDDGPSVAAVPISACLEYDASANFLTIYVRQPQTCSNPAMFRVFWRNGPLTYRIFSRRSIVNRGQFTSISDLGPATEGVGQDMKDYIDLNSHDNTLFFRNTNDQPIWVDAVLTDPSGMSAPVKFNTVIPARQEKAAYTLAAGKPLPNITWNYVERENS